jgi:glutamyl/glutaminyl-tRNA synthetase
MKLDPVKSKTVIENVIKKISNIEFDNKENISNCIKEVCSDMSLKFKDVGPAVRFSLTGRLKAPSIDELCFTLGKDKALKRLNDFYTFLSLT